MLRLPALLANLRRLIPPRHATDAAHLYHAILDLFLFVAEKSSEEAARQEKNPPSPPEIRARLHLDLRYVDGVPLADVAKAVGVSSAHLGRAFKTRYGVSPGHYRDTLRMEAARNLVANSDLLIKEIAFSLGYPDAATFSKAFLRHTGSSPALFRR